MPDPDLRYFLTSELARGHNPCVAAADEILTRCQGTDTHPILVLALIHVESGYDSRAVSPVGARGLMQLMPATAADVAQRRAFAYAGPDDLFDGVKNVRLGIIYLQELYTQFRKHWLAAFTAYNRGPGNTSKILANHGGKIPEPILNFYANLIVKKYAALIKRYPVPPAKFD